ncbi:hypothetical protein V0U35_13250 [Hyphobacterium sp. Y6023]|uniref:DUF4013 domain-containing protein n=2 Tax=Hyphobacterium marinum TaxID=3116574 RepID=A0ABU7M307_9PROT|nr:hypothetical protein [Hyphobacterium sp. Y6023]
MRKLGLSAALFFSVFVILVFAVEMAPGVEPGPMTELFKLPGTLALWILIWLVPVAVMRLGMTGETTGVAGLGFGGDEFRVGFGFWLMGFPASLASIPTMMIAIPLIGLAQATENLAVVIPVIFAGLTFGFSGYAYVMARLGPGLALSIRNKEFYVTRTWRATHPIRWRLLLVWLPWWLLYFSLTFFGLLAFPRGLAIAGGYTAAIVQTLFGAGVVILFSMAAATQTYVMDYLLRRYPAAASKIGASPAP